MISVVVVRPTIEPVTLSEAKAHLRLDAGTEDQVIYGLIRIARQEAERRTRRALINQTVECALDAFPEGGLELPKGRAQSITFLRYVDEAGVYHDMAPGDYQLDDLSDPAYIAPAYGQTWPATRRVLNAVRIRYVTGYGPDGSYVPDPITHWMLMRIADLYENRGQTATESPKFADALLAPFTLVEIQS